MNALNQIILEGTIVRQPERKEMPSGNAVCTLPVAVNRRYKSQGGELTDEVSYFDVDAYGNLAEVCAKWCPKGRGVRIVGRLKQNRWKDEDGKSHSRVKIIAEHIEFKPFQKKAEPADADTPEAEPALTKKQKLAMLAEAAGATRQELDAVEPVF